MADTKTQNAKKGVEIQLLGNEWTIDGYEFTGWNTSKTGDGITYSPGQTVSFQNSTTLYAMWRRASTPSQEYTVKFIRNHSKTDSNVVSERTVIGGNPVGELPTPSNRTGYNFRNWRTARDGGDVVTTDTIVNEDVEYYAKWAIKTDCVINWNGNDSTTGPTPSSLTGGTYLADVLDSQMPTVSKNGYELLGWSTTKTASEPDATKPFFHDGSITYYAIWKQLGTYSISIDPNGGSGGSVSKSTYTESTSSQTVTLTPPTREYFGFTGWSTTTGDISGNTLTIPAGATGNITVTANWTEPITITYYSNN